MPTSAQIIPFPVPERERYRDCPSSAMAAWLRCANQNGRLPVKDMTGRATSARIIRACEWRGWVKRPSPQTTSWGGEPWPSDPESIWIITNEGRAALKEADHGK